MPAVNNPATARRFGSANYLSPERTGWRDEEFSKRHRKLYGIDCPMVDGDFIVTEYDNGTARAVIDYKSCGYQKPRDISPANVAALCSLGHPALLPVAVVYYWPDTWAYIAVPMNPAANEIFAPRCEWFTEREYVRRLLALRGINPDDPRKARGVQWDELQQEDPPAVAIEWFGSPSQPLPAPGNMFRYAGRVMDPSLRTVELKPFVSLPPVLVRKADGSLEPLNP